jgi:hypothetical protein
MKEAHRDVVLNLIGRSSTSSTSDRLLASMGHYGLFEDRGSGNNRYFWPSQLAIEILRSNGAEREQALRKAVLRPGMMQEVFDKWGENIPPSKSIEKSLVLEFKFSPQAAELFSRVIADNYQYTGLTNGGKIETVQAVQVPETKVVDEPKTEVRMTSQNGFVAQQEKLTDLSASTQAFSIPLRNGRVFAITAPADITKSEFEYAQGIIELFKVMMVKKEETHEQQKEG